MNRKRSAGFVLSVALAVASLVSACEGCHSQPAPNGSNGSSSGGEAGSEAPSARLYLVSDLAGALEPCGCVKDQLGGMDHFGALVTSEKAKAPAYATLSAGPLFFMDQELAAEKKGQEVSKAETIASSMKALKLGAFAPSRNSWAGGTEELAKLRDASGAALLGANLDAPAVHPEAYKIISVGGLDVGVIGVAAPDQAGKVDAVSKPAIPAVKDAVAALKKQGVNAIVVLAAVGRGEAKRIADDNPDLLAIVVGSTGANGDENTKPAPPEQIGDVLVVEAANHLQTVGVLDLFARGTIEKGKPIKFADGTGVERMRKREELTGRIDELRAKIATWEKDKSVDPKDVAARKADVARLEGERDALDKTPAPKGGSFYRYSMREIRDGLGADEAVKSQMLSYYKKVNEENKATFKDKLPPPAPKGQASYVGIDVCTNCHEDARKVWDGTVHAHAYPTLEKEFKEANLDCVNCHVTGYDKPGGSTVTHVSDLKNVQCEVCHGPGSLHAAKPDKAKIPIAQPKAAQCLECHHPPHVHTFDAAAKMPEILGPGHGRPKT